MPLGKAMNPLFLLLAMGKIAEQIGLSHILKATNLRGQL